MYGYYSTSQDRLIVGFSSRDEAQIHQRDNGEYGTAVYEVTVAGTVSVSRRRLTADEEFMAMGQ